MTNQYNGIDITKLLLFGTTDVSADFNERVRAADAPEPVFNVDSDDFLATGAGDSCVVHSDKLYSYAGITIARDARNICEVA